MQYLDIEAINRSQSLICFLSQRKLIKLDEDEFVLKRYEGDDKENVIFCAFEIQRKNKIKTTIRLGFLIYSDFMQHKSKFCNNLIIIL